MIEDQGALEDWGVKYLPRAKGHQNSISEERTGLPSIQLDTTIMHAFKFWSEFLELYKLPISSRIHWETTVANGLSDIV